MSSFLHAVLILTAPPNVWLELPFEVLLVYILIYYYYLRKKKKPEAESLRLEKASGSETGKNLDSEINYCLHG